VKIASLLAILIKQQAKMGAFRVKPGVSWLSDENESLETFKKMHKNGRLTTGIHKNSPAMPNSLQSGLKWKSRAGGNRTHKASSAGGF
jgi:hypothetical protein